MKPTRVEVYPSEQKPDTIISPLTFEVDRSNGTVNIVGYPVGYTRLTEQVWDDLVQKVNEAFVEEPKIELETDSLFNTYHAPEEMVDALKDLPVQELRTQVEPADTRDRCWECGRIEEDTCSNCDQYPSEGHDSNCMAQALTELPTETYKTHYCKGCQSYLEGIHFPHCPLYNRQLCSNCGLNPIEGHDSNCMAGPP
ncbi:hypothetical protein LCGC14_0532250 [marine sediment metagenome]|uniref:Uncharacterized protein n=1 Tax=marine sediment metagenome TaxID=412755 RepID=A0A0F9UGM8_9ZZZZ